MTQQERIREIIIQLKQIRTERGLSLQDVHDLVVEAGGYLSLSSVKRVFAEGSEKQGFRYQDTIQPIVRALLSVTEETPENNDVTANEIDALKNVVLLKDSIIQELRTENEFLAEKNNRTETEAQLSLNEIKAEYQRKINHLLAEVEQLRKENENLWAEVNHKTRVIDLFLEKQDVIFSRKQK
jgi:hypothetical protein